MNTVVKETLNNFHKNGKSKKLYFLPRFRRPLCSSFIIKYNAHSAGKIAVCVSGSVGGFFVVWWTTEPDRGEGGLLPEITVTWPHVDSS